MNAARSGGMRRTARLLLVLPLLASACIGGPTATSPPTQSAPPAAAPTDPPSSLPASGSAEPGTEPSPAVALPDDPWRTAQLRDVRSGRAIVVNELIGRLVVIEPMAIWCTTCRAQQNEAREALARLGRDDIVYISLDVDPNESEPELAQYADQRGYPWLFVVASRDVARSLAASFGDQVLSPPSTPKIVVRPDGQAEVSFGIKPAAQLEAELGALAP